MLPTYTILFRLFISIELVFLLPNKHINWWFNRAGIVRDSNLHTLLGGNWGIDPVCNVYLQDNITLNEVSAQSSIINIHIPIYLGVVHILWNIAYSDSSHTTIVTTTNMTTTMYCACDNTCRIASSRITARSRMEISPWTVMCCHLLKCQAGTAWNRYREDARPSWAVHLAICYRPYLMDFSQGTYMFLHQMRPWSP